MNPGDIASFVLNVRGDVPVTMQHLVAEWKENVASEGYMPTQDSLLVTSEDGWRTVRVEGFCEKI